MPTREELIQKAKERNKERNLKYRKVAKFFLNKGLKTKEATCFNSRISYFRGENLFELIMENSTALKPIIQGYYTNEIKTIEDAKNLMKYLLDEKVLLQFNRDDEKKYKWPKKLILFKNPEVSEKGFYSWNLDLTGRSTFFLMILVLLVIFVICLFPVWPISAKLIIFYVSLVLLYFLLGFIFLRLFLFIVLRIFGLDSWIFPNLFEDVTFMESFRPIVSFKKSEDGWTELIARLMALMILVFLVYKLGQEPQIIKDYSDMGSQTFDDLMEWGRLRIEGKADEKIIKRGIPNLSDIINQEEENKTKNEQNMKENEVKIDNENEEKEDEGESEELETQSDEEKKPDRGEDAQKEEETGEHEKNKEEEF